MTLQQFIVKLQGFKLIIMTFKDWNHLLPAPPHSDFNDGAQKL